MPSRPGLALANILAGSWRDSVEPAEITAPCLEALAPRLAGSGTAGLAWERLRGTSLAGHPAALMLRDLQRHHALQRIREEQRLPRLFKSLRQARFEPLLIKGWSLMPLYARFGHRPVGDVDLCVPPDQFAAARNWLERHGDLACDVDLHSGIPDLADRGWECLWERSKIVALGGIGIRVLSPKDRLRLLCLHLARHGGWRPLWLCDVAAAAEAMPATFDWSRYLAEENVGTSWVKVVLALAGKLLQACVPQTSVPDWVVASVLDAWEAPCPGDSHSRAARPLHSYFAQPAGLWQALGQRWPNPLEAVFKMLAPPHARLRVLHQMRYWLRRGLRWRRKTQPHAAAGFDLHVAE